MYLKPRRRSHLITAIRIECETMQAALLRINPCHQRVALPRQCSNLWMDDDGRAEFTSEGIFVHAQSF